MTSSAAPPPVVDDAAAPPAEAETEAEVSEPALDGPGSDAGTADRAGRRAASEPVQLDPAVIDLAKAAAVAEAGIPDHIGDFVSALAEDDIAVTATFVARQVGYAGWHWSVTLAVLDQPPATVSEVVLLPGDGALLAPAWIPWDRRIRPGDVGVGDLLPPIEDDPRLAPAYVQSDDPAVEGVAHELGIGRVHVLSREGRVDFAERLHDGDFGPTAEIALAAPAHCFTCAFYLPLAGSLGQLVGACGNEYSPADGRVVDADFGCGAHSGTVIEMPARSATTLAVIDELSLEVHRRPVAIAAPEELGPVDEQEAVGGPAGSDATDDSAVVDAEVMEDELTELDPLELETVEPDAGEPDTDESPRAETRVVDGPAVEDATDSSVDGDRTAGD